MKPGEFLRQAMVFVIFLAGISILGIRDASAQSLHLLFPPLLSPNSADAPNQCTTNLVYDQTVECSIEMASEVDVFTFSGSSGERIIVRMLDTGGTTFSPQFEVHRPEGTQVCSANFWDPFIEADCTLDATGTYSILASDYNGINTGNYSLYLQRLNNPANATTTGYDQMRTGSINTPPELKAYTFSGVAGERVIVRMLDTGGTVFSPEFRLYRPDGTQLCSANFWDPFIEAECTLDATGTFAIFALDYGRQYTGNYSLYLQRLNNPVGCRAISFGAPPISDSIEQPPELDCFTFGGKAGNQARVTMVDTGGTLFVPEFRVHRPDGTQLCSANFWDPSISADCNLDATGSYAIFAGDDGGDLTGSYNISLVCLNTPCGFTLPTINEVRPNQGRSDLPNDINIYGSGFANGAVASLGSTALNTTFISSSQLRGVVPAGLTPGVYPLLVTNPDNGYASLPNAYTVLDVQDPGSDDLYGFGYEIWVDPPTPRGGETAKLGLVIHRQGGKNVLTNVQARFYLGDPQAGGSLIGTGVIPLLSPLSSASTTGISWTPLTASDYMIYAVIDPDSLINESNEDNNTVYRAITAMSPARDQLAPHVDSFTINTGAAQTNSRNVTLDTAVSDPEPSSGVASLLFIEYEYSQGAGLWVPVQISNWVPYETGRENYIWELLPFAGIHYLQAWAADGAGNISLFPYKSHINYYLPSNSVALGQSRIYRYNLQAGERLTVNVTPTSGDPDLYIWAPDHETRPPWVSNVSAGAEQISLIAPVDGDYQVEIYGYTAAEYLFTAEIFSAGAISDLPVVMSTNIPKPTPSQPIVPVASAPGDQFAVPTAPAEITIQPSLFMPLLRR